jgi:predicted Zn-dependent peptidase
MTVETTVLQNGLRVVTETMPHLETASLGVWVDVGARFETPATNGASHFLEHMAFKGTHSRSARRIVEEIEEVGGHLNAYTSRENTAYFAQVLKDDVPRALDVLADILQNSVFDVDELERERTVILQEIGQAFDTPDDLVFDYLQEAAYPDQPLGRSVLGTAKQISGFDRQVLITYMADHYRAPRMVIAAAGKVDHRTIVEQVEGLFADLDPGPNGGCPPARYQGGDKRQQKSLEQAHVLLGFQGVSYGDPDYYAAHVASMVFGGGMSSRLFQEVREKQGLAYSIYCYVSSYQDSGLFGIYAGTAGETVSQLVSVVADEAAKLRDHAEEDEVARARAQLKAGLLMSMESSPSRCEQLAKQTLIYGRVIPNQELIDAIDSVGTRAVQRVMGRLTGSGGLSLAALGPVEQLENYHRIGAKFES